MIFFSKLPKKAQVNDRASALQRLAETVEKAASEAMTAGCDFRAIANVLDDAAKRTSVAGPIRPRSEFGNGAHRCTRL